MADWGKGRVVVTIDCDDARAVAADLIRGDVDQMSLSSTPVKGGLNNCGCFLHKASRRGSRVSFFEKRTTKRSEIAFSSRAAPALFPTTPRIYRVASRPDYTAIFMEYLQGLGHPMDLSPEAARLFGATLADLAVVDIECPRVNTVGIPDQYMDILAKCAEEDGFAHEHLDCIRSIIASSNTLNVAARDRLPLVPCHGDMACANISFQVTGDCAIYRFIDWARFGLNYAGSDFYQLVRAALRDASFSSFTVLAMNRYADVMRSRGMNLSFPDVQFAANFHGLARSIVRYCVGRSNLHFTQMLMLYHATRMHL